MLLALLPAAAAALAAGGPACPSPPSIDRFDLDVGSALGPGVACDEYVLSSDATNGAFSWGGARDRTMLPAAYEVRLAWQRLTPDSHRSLELHLPGGALMVRDGAYGFYESEARFATDGWRPLPSHDTRRLHELRVRTRDGAVEVWIDGVAVRGYRFTTHPTGTLRIALKGERNFRARMRYRGPWIAPQ